MANLGNNKGGKSGYSANAGKRQAAGFINIYVPGKNGRRKLGAIFLYDDDVAQSNLMEWLEKDENNITKLAETFEVEYNPNKPDDEKLFVLPE